MSEEKCEIGLLLLPSNQWFDKHGVANPEFHSNLIAARTEIERLRKYCSAFEHVLSSLFAAEAAPFASTEEQVRAYVDHRISLIKDAAEHGQW